MRQSRIMNEQTDILLKQTKANVWPNSVLNGEVLAPNETWGMLDLSRNKSLVRWIYECANKLEIRICYSSVFEEHWCVERSGFQSNLEQRTLNRVESCLIKPEERFLK